MRHNLFLSILRQDVAFFDAHRSGEIVSRLTSDVQVRPQFNCSNGQNQVQVSYFVRTLYFALRRWISRFVLFFPHANTPHIKA